jgi:hypothetical protein
MNLRRALPNTQLLPKKGTDLVAVGNIEMRYVIILMQRRIMIRLIISKTHDFPLPSRRRDLYYLPLVWIMVG